MLDFDSVVLPGTAAFALRIIPAGSALPAGDVLVADSSEVTVLDSSGNQIRHDTAVGSGGNIFALSLDPDGATYWTADSSTATVFHVDEATGNILGSFNTGTGANTVFGLSIKGQLTAALSIPTPTPTPTPTLTPTPTPTATPAPTATPTAAPTATPTPAPTPTPTPTPGPTQTPTPSPTPTLVAGPTQTPTPSPTPTPTPGPTQTPTPTPRPTPASTTLNVTSVVANAGSVFVASATLGSGTSACSIGQPIGFIFQGLEQFATTGSNGVANVTFIAPSSAGTYAIFAFFEGTRSCFRNSAFGELSVPSPPPPPVPALTTLTVQNVSALPGATFVAIATLASSSAACLSGEPITFTLASQPVTVGTSNASGVASVLFRAPNNGTIFPIQANFVGNPSCAASSGIGNLSLVAPAASATVLSLGNVIAPGGALFNVTAILRGGRCGANQIVVFTFPAQNEQMLATTGLNDLATTSFTSPISPGTYPIVATFEGSSFPFPGCLPSTVSAQLTVLPPISTTLAVANLGVQAASLFTASATLGPRTCALGQSVSFVFNGATESGISNLNGVATASFIAPSTAETLPIQAFYGGTPTCAANSGSATVTVRGTNPGAGVILLPLTLSFPPQPIGSSSPPLTIELANNTRAALMVSSIVASGSKTASSTFREADNCVPAVAAQSACSISVSFTPAATGAESATLQINAVSHAQKVPLKGSGILAATVSPSQLSFGRQKLKTATASKQVRISNNLGVALSFNNFFIDGDFAITGNGCAKGVNAHGSCSVSIAFTPTVHGARTGSTTIGDTASSIPLTVSLTGTGN